MLTVDSLKENDCLLKLSERVMTCPRVCMHAKAQDKVVVVIEETVLLESSACLNGIPVRRVGLYVFRICHNS